MRYCAFAAVALFLPTLPGTAQPEVPAKEAAKTVLGKTIDAFSAPNTAGMFVSLNDFKGQKAVVVVFLGTACPINNAYLPRLAELHKEFAGKGVALLAVNSNSQDSAEDVARHAKQHNLPFPVLKDKTHAIANLLGAQRTPEAFVLDAARVVRYRGRIDDQHGIAYRRPQPTRRDLAEAVDEILAGKAVSQPTTTVAGCIIGRTVTPPAEAKITFSKHVAPLVQKHCQECHRPGMIGPMTLATYEDVLPWADTIREVLTERRMPPWHADPQFGKFANDRSLTREERETFLAWIDQGRAKGAPQELPAVKQFPSEDWTIGKPDMVFTMPREFKVPAQAPPRGVPYQHFLVPTNFKEDRWVQAVEAKPGNRAVVHHILVYARTLAPGSREDGIGEGLLATHAPGELPTVLAPGSAKKVPRGAVLVFQMHYTPNGTEQTDRSSVALIFAKEPPKYEVRTRSIAATRFSIPAGEANHQVVSRATFARDSVLLSLLPHMHLRGKSFIYRAIYPDGKEETLLSVPKYHFGWQANYRLATPLRLPAGTRVECTATFDNSAGNPNNPDPSVAVRWGEQTWQEMMIGFVDYAVVKEGQ